MRLLELEFKSDIIISKAVKFTVNKILPNYN